MNRNVYAIRDTLVGAYMSPVLGESDAAMIRQFGDAVTGDSKSPIAMHPADYTLEKIGTFDLASGLLVPCSPVVLAHATDFVKAE